MTTTPPAEQRTVSGETGGGLTAEEREAISRAGFSGYDHLLQRDPVIAAFERVLAARLADANARLAAVEALHQPDDLVPFLCAHDGRARPCPTVAALHPDPSPGHPASPSCSPRSCGQDPDPSEGS